MRTKTLLINSFGNLALIDPGLNSKLSNKWTDQKGAILKEISLQVIGLTCKESLSPKLRTLVALKKRDGTKLAVGDVKHLNAAWNKFVELAYEAYGGTHRETLLKMQ